MVSKPIDCSAAKPQLVAYLSGELSRRERKRLLVHLATCEQCSAEKEGLERVWGDLGILPEADVPGYLRDATLSSIEALLREEPAHIVARSGSKQWTQKVLTAVLGAIGLAILSLWALRGVSEFDRLSDETIFLCSSLFTGLLAATFLFATGGLPGISTRWQLPSRIALTGLGLVILGTLLCPKMSLVRWWETLPPGRLLLSYGEGISHGAFGLFYALIPFFLAVCLLGWRAKDDLLRHVLNASVLFFVLLLPAILLQALPLSSLVFFTWVVGSVFGVTIAAFSGVGVLRLTSSAQTAHT